MLKEEFESWSARAPKGGIVGINGEWYKGGRFLPLTIFCDKTENQIKRSKMKTASMITATRKTRYSFIVKTDSGYIYFQVSESEKTEIWNDLYKKVGTEIIGFEHYINGKRFNACGYID